MSADYLKFLVKTQVALEAIKAFAKTRSIEEIRSWLKCSQENVKASGLEKSYGFIHQDLVNILGERLGFSVQYGKYMEGPDGIWALGDVRIVVDSKTSSFWLDVSKVEGFASAHNATVGIAICGDISEDKVATVRGGFPKVRLMTTDGLCRLTELREKGVLSTENVKDVLIPTEAINLDNLIDLIHAIVEKKEEEPPVEPPVSDRYPIDAVPEQIRSLSPVTRAMYIILQKNPERWLNANELEQEIVESFLVTFKEQKKPISWGFPFAGTALEKKGLIEIKRNEHG